jgi:preprotein translocase subunit SecE
MKDMQQFFKEVRLEFSKILWPSTNELVGSLIVVLLLVLFFSVYLGAVDYVFYRIAEQIF